MARPSVGAASGSRRAVGAVGDARPDQWGERVIRYVVKPARLSLMEYPFYAGDDRLGVLGSRLPARRTHLARILRCQGL
jgi:serine/threonine-protein kinase HipA